VRLKPRRRSLAGLVYNRGINSSGPRRERTSYPGRPASQASAVARPAAPKSGTSAELHAVTCTSASNCWAVGDLVFPFSNPSEALHWDGASWSDG
jgi:hypothetical protein